MPAVHFQSTPLDPGVEEQSRDGRARCPIEQKISGSTDIVGCCSASDTREHEPDRPRKRGPKRGPNPLSKPVPTGHRPSQRACGTRSDESPGPALDFSVWRAKEMVDRGRIELPTPGFSVP
jgi:hypothetical protein